MLDSQSNNQEGIKEKVIASLLEIYKQNFGETTAQLYLKFYADKDIKTILSSAQELIEESLGEAKGKEVFNRVCTQCGVVGEINE